jgi:hypothetical protein
MSKFFALLTLLLFVTLANAQKAKVSGSIADTINYKPMAYSSISLVRQSDSVLVAHQWATDKADFTFNDVPPGEYILQITRPTFADYEEKLSLKENEEKNLGTIVLISKANLLKEIIVQEKKNAITIKGDTTEYLVDSFLTNKASNVEDLLKKLPGIQVDKNGKITAQGQEVKKVLVDGEEFFGSDPTIATQNIRADNVETVQVFDKKSDQAAFTGIDDGEKNKTINLKLKEDAKKGYFGKTSAAEGKDENGERRYEYDAMVNAFKSKRKFSVYGATSNTNKTQLNWEDREKFLGGGSNTVVDDASGAVYSYYDGGAGDFNGVGVPQTMYYGAFFSDKLKEDKHALVFNASHKEMQVNGFNNNYTKYILPDTLYYNNQYNTINNHKLMNNASGRYELKIDSLTTMKVNLTSSQSTFNNESIYTTENLNGNAALVNRNNREQVNNGESMSFVSKINLNKKFRKKGRSLATEFEYNYNSNKSDGFLKSETQFFNPDGSLKSASVIDQKKINNSDVNMVRGNVVYTEPLSEKWFVVTDYDLRSTVNNSERVTYEKNGNNEYANELDSLSNSLRYDILVNKGGLALRYNSKKLIYSFGGKASYTDLRQRDLVTEALRTQYFFNLFPSANIQYKVRSNTSLNMNYSGSTRQPTLQQIQPVLDNSNPLDVFVGNPNLEQSFNNNINLSYNNYKALSGTSFYASASYNFTQNDFTSYDVVDEQGRKVHQTVNVDGNRSANLWTNYWFKIKSIGLGVSQNMNGNYSLNNNFLNGQSNLNTSYSGTYGLNFYYDIEDKFETYIGGDWTYNQSLSSLRSDVKTKYWIQSYEASASYTFPKQFKIGTEVEMNIRQKTSDFDRNLNNILWDAWISKGFFPKEKLLLKLSVVDLLNQNIGFRRTANSNYINENTYTVLRRYALISLTWNFSKGGANAQ